MSDICVQIVITIVAVAAVIYRLYMAFYKPEQTKTKWRVLICSFVCFFGLCVLWNGEERDLARESIKWPITDGHVICSRNANYATHEPEYLYHYGYKGGGTGRRIKSEVKYSYTVNGHTYSSWNIAYNATIRQQDDEVETKYQQGSLVAVRYSPSDPSKSCLEIGNTNLLGQGFFMALILLIVPLGIAYQQANGNVR